MREIPVYSHRRLFGYAKVDDSDFEFLHHFLWVARNGYASSEQGSMHRVVCPAPAGMVVDHIDRDRLNNQRSNLRVISYAANSQNLPAVEANGGYSSRYRGVRRRWANSGPKWIAAAKTGDKKFRMGFDDELEAALAVTAWRLENMPFSTEDPELVAELEHRRAVTEISR